MNLARIALLSLVVCTGTLAQAGMLFDRGLPEANLNNGAGSNRSNVAWATYWNYNDTDSYMYGDDFTLGAGKTYKVTNVKVWVVGGSEPFYGNPMSLWGGSLSSGAAGIGFLSSTYSTKEVGYVGGSNYQGSSGSYLKIWEVDFTTNWFVDGGDTQLFFVGGQVVNNNGLVYPDYEGYVFTPFLHASNKDLSGSAMQGADDLMYWAGFEGQNLVEIGTWSSDGDGWDKASDFNVQVLGEAVPGPAAVLPFALGLLASARRRRK